MRDACIGERQGLEQRRASGCPMQIAIRDVAAAAGQRSQTVRYDRPLPASDRLGISNRESDVS